MGGGTGGRWNLPCINRNHYIPPFPGVHRQAFVHFSCFGEAVCVCVCVCVCFFHREGATRGFNFYHN